MENNPASSQFTIRAANQDDTAVILSLIKELAAYERLSHEVVATEKVLRESLFGDHAYAEVLIGELEDVPVGFALFFHNYSTFLGKPGIYIEDIYVKPAHRGNGLGLKYFEHIARLAKKRNCGRIEWWVLNWNEPAINFYKKMDAVPMDEWTVYRLTGQSIDALADN